MLTIAGGIILALLALVVLGALIRNGGALAGMLFSAMCVIVLVAVVGSYFV